MKYTLRHSQKIEELLSWNHILENYENLKQKTKKIWYELDAELIDYTKSLEDFLKAVEKYSTIWKFEKFVNFGDLLEEKYKKMI